MNTYEIITDWFDESKDTCVAYVGHSKVVHHTRVRTINYVLAESLDEINFTNPSFLVGIKARTVKDIESIRKLPDEEIFLFKLKGEDLFAKHWQEIITDAEA